MYFDSIHVLYHDALPEGEREHSRFVESNLRGMKGMVEEFRAATELVRWSQQESFHHSGADQNRLHKWLFIGARAGAMFLYGFHRSSQELQGCLSKCPTLHSHFDKKELGEWWKKFDNSFPNFADVRTSAAHPAEFYNTSKKRKKHALTAPITNDFGKIAEGSNVIMDGVMIGDRFSYTVEGQIVSYSTGQGSTDKLQEIFDGVKRVLEPAFTYSETLYQQQRANNSSPKL